MSDRRLALLAELRGHRWAILPERLRTMLAVATTPALFAEYVADLEKRAASPSPFAERGAGGEVRATLPRLGAPVKMGALGLLAIHGPIFHRSGIFSEMFGGVSTERLGREIKAMLADPDIKTIVLDVNSPGGGVHGVEELHALLMGAREQKPIVAVANAMTASAAYWIASAATHLIATPSADVGSIGVFMLHVDESEFDKRLGFKVSLIHAGTHKVEGNPFEPLTEEARARFQAEVEAVHEIFVRDVAKGRGTNAAAVRKDFGDGRVFNAREALSAGMVDAVASLDDVLARLHAGKSPVKRMRAEDVQTLRDLEAFLREEGLSKEAAKLVISKARASRDGGALGDLEAPPALRDGEGDQQAARALEGLAARIRTLTPSEAHHGTD